MVASQLLYLLLVLACLPGLLYLYLPDFPDLVYPIDFIVLSLLLLDFFLTPQAKAFKASRSCAKRFSIGRNNEVEISLSNFSKQKITCLLKDDYPLALECSAPQLKVDLAPGSETTISYSLKPTARGSYDFKNISIRYKSRLGLFWRQITFKAPYTVQVFSDLKGLSELSIKLNQSTELGEIHRRKRGQGTVFSSLRDYAVGDDCRDIDWKATARRDRPVVRNYEVEQEQTILILIDAGRMMLSDLEGLSKFDHALNSALSLTLAALSRNDQVGLGIFADKPLLYIPPRRGKSNLNRILEATYHVKPKMVEPDYSGALAYFASNQKGRCLMVVISDLTDPLGSKSLLNGIASLSKQHLSFCVTLKDKRIDALANTQQATPDDIYKRAIAIELQSERQIALTVLERHGTLILDCPPQDLSNQLINSYLDIKARGRL